MEIEANLTTYLAGRKPSLRYSSFDYCFNYFQSHYKNGRLSELSASSNMQYSCLQLGFYLASWGMFRGASDLLKKSVKHYAPLIDIIASSPLSIWEIDAHNYSDDSWEALKEVGRKIRRTIHEDTSDVLVTKIMLGVFGCVPAFDTYFKSGFGVSTFGRSALRRLSAFYEANAETIERFRVSTLDFATGGDTEHKYTRAKVIDMIFFIEGIKLARAKLS